MTKAAFHALGLAALLCAVLFAVGPGSVAAASPTQAFRAAPCTFPGANLAAQYDIDCGFVTVPEHRDRPSTRTIELAVAIAHRTQPGTDEGPVLFLNGGPGDSALFQIADIWGTSTIRERHDIILFDQRGTGYSDPAMPCRALDFPLQIDLPTPDQDAERVRLATICLDEFRAKGIDVTAYTTQENAADVESVRLALGIERWSLYGISYGTRLALEVMRAHGTTVTSAVLDSPYPPQARPFEDATAKFERAMAATLIACSENAACAGAYPNVGSRLGALLSNGDAPLDRAYPTVPASYVAAVLNGLLYSSDGIASLPVMVDGLERGNAMFIRHLYNDWQQPFLEASSSGMHYSVECHDRAFAVDEAAIAMDRALHITYGPTEGARTKRAVCATWGADPPSADELAPVVSDVPTLILVGAFDPVTPPSYAAETVRTLRNGSVVEFPGFGHAVTLTPCGHTLRDAFLGDPSAPLDRSCVEALPASTFLTDIASVPGLPYLVDEVFARSGPTIGDIGIALTVAIAFASAIVGWPAAAAVRAVRARRARIAVAAAPAEGDAETGDQQTASVAVGPFAATAAPTPTVLRLTRLLALPTIAADVVFVVGLVRVFEALPEGSLVWDLGVPRENFWLIWLADAGAALAIVVGILTIAVLLTRSGRRRSRVHLVYVALACLFFSGVLAAFRILGA